jgi:beta-glucosidase
VRHTVKALAACAAFAGVAFGAPAADTHAADAPRWLDSKLSPDTRAELLNRELTLHERIGMVHGIWSRPDRDITVPSDAIISAGYVPGVPRLGIPALYETDASLGITNPLRLRPGDGATALPASLALAATFSPELAYNSGVLLGSEARAKGFNVLLATSSTWERIRYWRAC